MSDDKLKQDHVFVKNNVGSLALHKAKQEIGEIKMDFTNEELKHIWGVMIFRANDGDYLTEELDKQIADKLAMKYIENGNWKTKGLEE